jgi:hypothetical protein
MMRERCASWVAGLKTASTLLTHGMAKDDCFAGTVLASGAGEPSILIRAAAW